MRYSLCLTVHEIGCQQRFLGDDKKPIYNELSKEENNIKLEY